MNNYERKANESTLDYKQRLYSNKKEYGISWKEVSDILGKDVSGDHMRKSSYGYMEAIKDMEENKFDKNILFLNDIHLPFERSDVIEIIKKHKHQITHLFIGGDLLDCYSVSKFTHDNSLSITDELKYGHKWLKNVRKILGVDIPIYVIKGNHEARWSKEVLKDPVLQNFINPEILQMYVDGFELFIGSRREKFEPIHNLHYIPSWYVNIDNKVIYCHPTDFSQVDGKMCEKVSEHFINKNEEFDVVVFAHTHKYSQMTVSRRKGVYTVENGCLCKPHGYAETGKLGYTPQSYCYSMIGFNNDERVSYNNIRVYHLEEESANSYKVSKVDL